MSIFSRRTLLFLGFWTCFCLQAQDTFSIVAVDSTTGEVGSAGASCLDDSDISGGVTIIGDLIPGLGAINTQSFYISANQGNARNRLLLGESPTQVLNWLIANDAQGDSTVRQYGIASFDSLGQVAAAAFTGSNCFDYKGQRVGPDYAIQGNILLGPEILDSMEARFLQTSGPLATRLMAALQGANVPGADTRCLNEGVSSQSAYLAVARPNDPAGVFTLDLSVTETPFGVEPIDSLQSLFDAWTPPNCQIAIPATAISVSQDSILTIDNADIWVCSPDTLFLNGSFNTVYLENEAACVVQSGAENKVFLRRTSYFTAPGILRSEVYYQPGSTFEVPGFFPTYFSCDSVEYDYTDAPFGACRVDTATSLTATGLNDFRWHYDAASRQLWLEGNNVEQAQLLNTQGQMIQHWLLSPRLATHALTLKPLNTGLYLIRLQHQGGIFSRKIWLR